MSVFLTTISIIFCICMTTALSPLISFGNYEINPDCFKKIKIKKLSFLFKGWGGKNSIYNDVKNYGVILPIFILYIIGYFLALVIALQSLIMIIIFKISYKLVTISNFALLGIFLFLSALTIISCILISKKKTKS